jgi:deazaflavin-dependent oxidoreductase (nitroreductase family)
LFPEVCDNGHEWHETYLLLRIDMTVWSFSIMQEVDMPRFLWRLMMIGPKLIYRLGLGWIIGDQILLLTTTGRVSKLPRVTPLQYESVDGGHVIGSARGLEADWVKNILKDPRISVKLGRNQFEAVGRVISEPDEVADFLEQRYANNPNFMKILFWMQGYRGPLQRDDFIRYAENRVFVEVIREID